MIRTLYCKRRRRDAIITMTEMVHFSGHQSAIIIIPDSPGSNHPHVISDPIGSIYIHLGICTTAPGVCYLLHRDYRAYALYSILHYMDSE